MHSPESKRRDMTRAFFSNRAGARRAARSTSVTIHRRLRHDVKQQLHVLQSTTTAADIIDDAYHVDLPTHIARWHWASTGNSFTHWARNITQSLPPEDRTVRVASLLHTKAGRVAAIRLLTYDYINPSPFWTQRAAKLEAQQDQWNKEWVRIRMILRLIVEDADAHRELNALLRSAANNHIEKTGQKVTPRLFLGIADIDSFMAAQRTRSASSWKSLDVVRKFASELQERLA